MKVRESGMPEEDYWGTFFNPMCIVRKLDCSGACGDVIEFGCGYGTFTIAAAELVQDRVYALDIDPMMTASTQSKLEVRRLTNVEVEVRDFLVAGCGRPDGSAGYAMLFNILHVEEPVELLREAYRALRPGGKVGVIHWKPDPETPRGPPLAIRPTAEQCRKWGEQAGFRFDRYEELGCCSYHYGLVLSKPVELIH